MGKCYSSTVIDAPIEHLWETIKNFHDLSWGSAVVTSTDKVGSKNSDEIGAQRILNNAFHETLLSIDNSHFTSLTVSMMDPAPSLKGLYKAI